MLRLEPKRWTQGDRAQVQAGGVSLCSTGASRQQALLHHAQEDAQCLAAFAAYGFTRFFPHGATPFIVFLLFTKMLPETLLIIPYFQLMSDLGLLDTYVALILAYSSFALPFSVWMLIGFFRSIPRDIDEAAMIDGASYLQTFSA